MCDLEAVLYVRPLFSERLIMVLGRGRGCLVSRQGSKHRDSSIDQVVCVVSGYRTKRSLKNLAGMIGCIGLLCVMLSACTQSVSDEQTTATKTYALGDSIMVSGVLVDSRCFYLDKPTNRNVDHIRPEPEGRVPGCGKACALQGFPVAVLEGGDLEGMVWILSFPSQVFADYMAQTVRVYGEFRSEGIVIPNRVEMQTSDGWLRIM